MNHLEDVDERIGWEARRVGAAFGVETFTHSRYNATLTDFFAQGQDCHFWWVLDSRPERFPLRALDIKRANQRCQVSVTNILGTSVEKDRWVLIDQGVLQEEMARVLYRLGFDEEKVLSQLPLLTMHEKMELRLSLAREFWPEKWLEEG